MTFSCTEGVRFLAFLSAFIHSFLNSHASKPFSTNCSRREGCWRGMGLSWMLGTQCDVTASYVIVGGVRAPGASGGEQWKRRCRSATGSQPRTQHSLANSSGPTHTVPGSLSGRNEPSRVLQVAEDRGQAEWDWAECQHGRAAERRACEECQLPGAE